MYFNITLYLEMIALCGVLIKKCKIHNIFTLTRNDYMKSDLHHGSGKRSKVITLHIIRGGGGGGVGAI